MGIVVYTIIRLELSMDCCRELACALLVILAVSASGRAEEMVRQKFVLSGDHEF